MARAFECPLIGGDTTSTPGPLSFSITAFGLVPQGQMVQRSTVRSKDLIAVTGTIGDGALGLLVKRDPDQDWVKKLSPAARDFLRDRYLHPQPRLALVSALRRHAHAAMDVSDGLTGDLAKLLRAANQTGRMEVETVPLSFAAQQVLQADPSLLNVVLTGGDDYEILFSFAPAQRQAVEQAARSNPQLPILRQRAAMLEQAIEAEGQRVAGGGRSLASKAPEAPRAVFDWSGFYIGSHFSAVAGHSNWSSTPAGGSGSTGSGSRRRITTTL